MKRQFNRQPPMAEMVDPFLKMLPISPATSKNCLISFRPLDGFRSLNNTLKLPE
jgi:hypothetical protein